ncbi:MarR family winged helix-turn-helix transcriptional regulator [Clostridium sporogenes]|uniref:MarR family winged helix-turn-helix transcriptional regulator n=2 Tax=Clostridium TaxID=1485 RepID=UPI0039DF5B24
MMYLNNERKNKISYSLLTVIYKFSENDKQTRYYGTDTPLFSSEIHMIRAIKEEEGIHITGLANKLGVTKGAVSQIVNKLDKKGFIKKETDLHNQSKLIIKLTPKGEIADTNHKKLHNKFDALINDILKDASNEEIAFLKSFLNKVEEQIEDFEEKIME